MADGVVDLKNIDDVIATLSLRETGLALEANVDFKPGYQSMAYSLIHTPNLNKADLKAVPADAVALVSLTLGAAGTPQAQAASEKIKSATGLDLGAEIFGNIQQVSLFVVPPRESVLPQGPQVPPIVRSIGLAITSRDPEKTQKLLMTLLQMANLVAPDDTAAPHGHRPVRGRPGQQHEALRLYERGEQDDGALVELAACRAVRHGGQAERLRAQRRPLAGCPGDPVADDQQAGPDQRRRGPADRGAELAVRVGRGGPDRRSRPSRS